MAGCYNRQALDIDCMARANFKSFDMDCNGYCSLISRSHIIELMLGIRVADGNSIVEIGLL